jgi:hypothetical protein
LATLIRTNGAEETVTPANGKVFSLEEMQAFVGGDIQLLTLPDGREIVLAEEGKVLGMPENPKGTLLLQTVDGIIPDDYCVGDILVCTLAEAGGE